MNEETAEFVILSELAASMGLELRPDEANKNAVWLIRHDTELGAIPVMYYVGPSTNSVIESVLERMRVNEES